MGNCSTLDLPICPEKPHCFYEGTLGLPKRFGSLSLFIYGELSQVDTVACHLWRWRGRDRWQQGGDEDHDRMPMERRFKRANMMQEGQTLIVPIRPCHAGCRSSLLIERFALSKTTTERGFTS